MNGKLSYMLLNIEKNLYVFSNNSNNKFFYYFIYIKYCFLRIEVLLDIYLIILLDI